MKSIRRQVNCGRDAGRVEIRAERFLSNFFPGFHSEDVTDQWQRCRNNTIIRLLSHGAVHAPNRKTVGDILPCITVCRINKEAVDL